MCHLVSSNKVDKGIEETEEESSEDGEDISQDINKPREKSARE